MADPSRVGRTPPPEDGDASSEDTPSSGGDAHLTRLLIAALLEDGSSHGLLQSSAKAETLRTGLTDRRLCDLIPNWLRRHGFTEMAGEISALAVSGLAKSERLGITCDSFEFLHRVEELVEVANEEENVRERILDLSDCDIVEVDTTDATEPYRCESIALDGNLLRALPMFPRGKYSNISLSNNLIAEAVSLTPETFTRACDCVSLQNNQIAEITKITTDIRTLNVSTNRIIRLLDLPTSLTTLYVVNNLLVELPALPETLERLDVRHNRLKELPPLPSSLSRLYVGNNCLKSLPRLPETLSDAYLDENPWDDWVVAALGGNVSSHISDYEKFVRNINEALARQGRATKAARAG